MSIRRRLRVPCQIKPAACVRDPIQCRGVCPTEAMLVTRRGEWPSAGVVHWRPPAAAAFSPRARDAYSFLLARPLAIHLCRRTRAAACLVDLYRPGCALRSLLRLLLRLQFRNPLFEGVQLCIEGGHLRCSRTRQLCPRQHLQSRDTFRGW